MVRGAVRALAGLFVLVALGNQAAAQDAGAEGTIAGTVIDAATAEPIIEAGVEIIGRPKKVRTDLDGNFSIKVPVGTYELRLFAPLYQGTRLRNVVVVAGKVARADASLKPEGEAGVETVEVVAEAAKAAEATQLLQRKQAPVVSDNISAQTIEKSPDSDAAEVVQRVPAVTIKDGKFIVVRGLGERFSSALLNGSRLPSTDPNKRVVPLDLFPADFIDALNIIKGYTPDLPGDFSGGLVDIQLREFPPQLSYSVGTSVSSNTAITGHEFQTYKGSDTDYFGFGTKYRELPDTVPGKLPSTVPDGALARGYASGFRNIWDVETKTAPPNFGLDVSAGNTFGPLGISLSGTYGNEYKQRTNELATTFSNPEQLATGRGNGYIYDRSTFETNLGAVLTSGLKLSPDHQVSLRGLVNRKTYDETLVGSGERAESNPGITFFPTQLEYTEDQLGFGQLGGKHHLKWVDLDWRTALSQSTEEQPDTRLYEYRDTGEGAPELRSQGDDLLRTFANLDEWLSDSAVDLTVPFRTQLPATDVWSGLAAKFKGGVAYAYRDRNFDYRRFRYTNIPTSLDTLPSPEQILVPENIGGAGFVRFGESSTDADSFKASQEIAGAYGMLDLPIIKDRVRVVAGSRVEYSYIQLEGASRDGIAFKRPINDLDPMPAVNLIYSPRDDMNFRYGFSQTVSRPEFRELTPTLFIVPGGERTTVGNPNLVSASITSHDVRWEWFFSPLELVSASVFYKDLKDPIETVTAPLVSSVGDTFENAEDATLYGGELELRKDFGFLGAWLQDVRGFETVAPALRNLTFQTNASIVESEVTIPPGGIQTNNKRALQGQAPFVVNAALEYVDERWGTTRLFYNTIDRQIVAAGASELPDIYLERRDQIDLVWVGKFSPFDTPLKTKFAVENILNDPFHETQGGETTKRYTTGIKFSVGVSYSF